MSKPMENKSDEIKAVIEEVFPGTAARIAAHKCPCCQQDIGPFRNTLSHKEYQISGLCQKCQDSVFGGGDE